MTMIDILLSIYNGEAYLRQQIDSLLSQSFQKWHLTMRDDGSMDNTMNICKEYVERYPEKIRVLEDDLGNLRVNKTYEILLNCSTNDYVMFCDHDDIWLPDKILDTYEQMVTAEASFGVETPILVCTDLRIVDSQLNLISESLFKYAKRNPHIDGSISKLIMADITYGCTIMINKSLKNLCKGFPEAGFREGGRTSYDQWLAILAVTFGKLICLDKQTIIYRRHGSTVSITRKYSLMKYLKGGDLIAGHRRGLNRIFERVGIFYNLHNDMMTLSQRKLFEDISSIPSRNWFMRRYLIMKYKLFKTGLVKNIGVFITV